MADARTSSRTESVLQLKVRLLGISPMIWRRVLVSETMSLHELHEVLQVAMGWEGIHLFQFNIRGIMPAGPYLHGQAVDMPLSDFRFRRNGKFRHVYDMGCWWDQELRMEDRVSATPGKRYPVCTDGSGICPLEDCGGPDGYFAGQGEAMSLNAMKDLWALQRGKHESGHGEGSRLTPGILVVPIYNKAVNSPGRINFTLAHEFGHYLLHRQDYPKGIECRQDDIVRWDSDYSKIEQQANEFAAALLMPLPDYCQQIESQIRPTLKDIGACAKRYGVSLTAATLRWLDYTLCRAILVLSRDGFILWSHSSPRALKTGAYFRTTNQALPLPEASLPKQPDWLYNGSGSVSHDAGIWLKEPCHEIALLSDQYDFAISLLHLYDVVSRCDSDDFD